MPTVLAGGLVAGAVLIAGLTVTVVLLRRHLTVVDVWGRSMEPALHAGDRVLVRRTRLQRIRRGDIVVYHDPSQLPVAVDARTTHPDTGHTGTGPGGPDRLWTIKRVAAVPGDPVPAVVAPVVGAAPGSPVPPGCLVVLGDNLDHSYDSRDCGYLTAAHLLGVVRRRI